LDDLVGPRQDRGWEREAQRLGGLEVGSELMRGRRLDGEVGGLRALEDPGCEASRAAEDLVEIGRVGTR
jgi:hypothetical protein